MNGLGLDERLPSNAKKLVFEFVGSPDIVVHLPSEMQGLVTGFTGSSALARVCRSTLNAWQNYGRQAFSEAFHAYGKRLQNEHLIDRFTPIKTTYPSNLQMSCSALYKKLVNQNKHYLENVEISPSSTIHSILFVESQIQSKQDQILINFFERMIVPQRRKAFDFYRSCIDFPLRQKGKVIREWMGKNPGILAGDFEMNLEGSFLFPPEVVLLSDLSDEQVENICWTMFGKFDCFFILLDKWLGRSLSSRLLIDCTRTNAVVENRSDILELIIDRSAARFSWGTSLASAAIRGNIQALEIILDRIPLRENEELGAFSYSNLMVTVVNANKKNQTPAIRLILNKTQLPGNHLGALLCEMANHPQLESFNAVLEKGGDQIPVESLNQALAFANRAGCNEIISRLQEELAFRHAN